MDEARRRVRGGKAVEHEFLRIDSKAGTAQTDTEIVFENPEHDFPMRISYRKTADGFLARIDGGPKAPDKHQNFPMKSVSCTR